MRHAVLAPSVERSTPCEAPRRLFVQWVPHGFGYKSLNMPFCLWVWRRARGGDSVHADGPRAVPAV